ncbi:MAG: phenylalanine--tRNA ligase subunit beta [Nitrososphaerota archaeon]
MKISYNWLNDYVEIEKSPEQLAEDLSLFGHEVESVEKIGYDYILDLEITPNRGDCLSVLGIAREISALYNVPLKKKDNFATILNSMIVTNLGKKIDIQIADSKICPRFTARIIDGVKIGESPKWMRERLATYGFRPVNNIVDITNYVMIATGQPLHAFDYDKIKDGKMFVRQAKEGEEVITLDGKNHVLPDGAIIIEDSEKIYDLAGIMGGIKSEVNEHTKTIILQGAIFDPVLIRKTSKKLNHVTDASYRYERGVDYQGTIRGVNMATTLVQKSCPQAKIGELIDFQTEKWQPTTISWHPEKDTERILGIKIDYESIMSYLARLRIKCLKCSIDKQNCEMEIPSYRQDLKIAEDLVEEVARVYGYNRIGKRKIEKEKMGRENRDWMKREAIKDALKALGFTEIYSYSFADKKLLEMLSEDKNLVEVANPLSPETQYLRPSILPSLISQIAKNPWSPDVNIFEIEKVFDKLGEKWQLGIATVGKTDAMLRNAIAKLNLKTEIKSVEQKILDAYKIRRSVKYVIEDMDEIRIETKEINKEISKNRYKPISKFPPTVRDLAFIVAENIKGEKVKEAIESVSENILLIELFDEYTFPNKTKNLAFHIWLQNMKGPMEEKEVGKIIEKIEKMIENKFRAKLRH